MAGQATLAISLKVTGIGDDINVANSQTLTVPVEALSGYTITAGSPATTCIALLASTANIALAKVYGVYIKAEVGTIYITMQVDGTVVATNLTTSADMTLLVGESCFLPYNNGVTTPAGIQVGGSAAIDAFSWVILGKA